MNTLFNKAFGGIEKVNKHWLICDWKEHQEVLKDDPPDKPYCYKCHLQVDRTKPYARVYPGGGKEWIYHIECFHEDYPPSGVSKA